MNELKKLLRESVEELRNKWRDCINNEDEEMKFPFYAFNELLFREDYSNIKEIPEKELAQYIADTSLYWTGANEESFPVLKKLRMLAFEIIKS